MKKRLLWMAPLALVGIAVFLAIGGELVKLLWNAVLPALFGWPRISFWQGLGLLALCRILFGGLGRGGGSTRSRLRGKVRGRMAERFEAMTPEERARFRSRYPGFCGGAEPPRGEAAQEEAAP